MNRHTLMYSIPKTVSHQIWKLNENKVYNFFDVKISQKYLTNLIHAKRQPKKKSKSFSTQNKKIILKRKLSYRKHFTPQQHAISKIYFLNSDNMLNEKSLKKLKGTLTLRKRYSSYASTSFHSIQYIKWRRINYSKGDCSTRWAW